MGQVQEGPRDSLASQAETARRARTEARVARAGLANLEQTDIKARAANVVVQEAPESVDHQDNPAILGRAEKTARLETLAGLARTARPDARV